MFNRETVTVKTLTKTLADGKYTTTETTKNITASIQNYEPDELILQEFGDRFREWVLIVSSSELKTEEVVNWRSKNFRIMRVSNYSNIGLIKSAQYQALGVLI